MNPETERVLREFVGSWTLDKRVSVAERVVSLVLDGLALLAIVLLVGNLEVFAR